VPERTLERIANESSDPKKDSDSKSENVKIGLTERYIKGLPNGEAPVGFTNDKSKEKGDRGWLIDEENFQKIKLVFQRFLLGLDSITSIHQYASEELCISTNRTEIISRSQIHSTLRSPIYAGFFFSKDEYGYTRTRRELDKILPRIITEDEHEKIKMMLSNKATTKTQSHKLVYIGFIKGLDESFVGADVKVQVICDCKNKFSYRNRDNCPKCGVKVDRMESPKYLVYNYYYNVKRRKTKDLKAKIIEEKKINTYLKNYVEENITISKELCEWAKKYIHELKDKEIQENQTIVKSQSESVSKIQIQLKKLRYQHRNGHITDLEYEEDKRELEQQLLKSEKEPKQIDWLKQAQEVLDLGVELQNIIENGTVEEKRTILSRLGSNLIWNEEKLSIINSLKRVKNDISVFEPRNYGSIKGQNTSFEVPYPDLLRGQDSNQLKLLIRLIVVISREGELQPFFMSKENKH